MPMRMDNSPLNLKFIRWHDSGVDIVPALMRSKAHTVLDFCKKNKDLQLKITIAFGDGFLMTLKCLLK